MIPNVSDYLKYVKKASLRVINEGEYEDGQKVIVHQFNRDWIKQVVNEDIKNGNYRIGLLIDGSFNVSYIGRSTDQTLQERILQHTNPNDDHYFDDDHYFFFKEAGNDEEAIEQECIDYHSFGGDEEYLDNEYHPSLPDDNHCPWSGCDHVGS